jgi:hypothetical protein
MAHVAKQAEPGLMSLWRNYIAQRKSLLEWDESYFRSLLVEVSNLGLSPYTSYNFPAFSSDEWMQPPARTIVIPVDLMKESPETLERTLWRLRKVCRGMHRTEVVIWFNSYCDKTLAQIPGSITRFEEWAAELEGSRIGTRTFRLRAVHKFRKYETTKDGAFNEIRSAYMDAILNEARPRHFRFMHPVWWLDADTPFMTRGFIRKCERALREQYGHFVKANLQYSGDNPSALPFRERSGAEKVAALYAITRRMLERNLDPTADRGYVEESGLLMALGKYMLSGGVGISNPLLGESRTMLARAARALDTSIPLVYHVTSARIGNSYRRVVELARSMFAWELPGKEEGEDYEDYTSMKSVGLIGSRRDSVTVEEVQDMVRRLEEIQAKRSGTGLTAAQHRCLKLIVARFGFACDDQTAPSAAVPA